MVVGRFDPSDHYSLFTIHPKDDASYRPPPVTQHCRRATRAHDQRLITLAAPLLELVLKLQTGIIPASNDVRPVVDDLLRQLEAGAATLGCSYKHAQDVKFALVAFVDETILNPANQFPLRDEWERNPLQLEHFSEHLAGVKFFEKLDPMLPTSRRTWTGRGLYLCLCSATKVVQLPVLEEQ